jgi:hypothetical protein
MASSVNRVTVNRAPVLTLWAAVVAEHLGFDWNEALTLGRAVAGLNAYSKGKALGIFHPKPKELAEKRKELKHDEELQVNLLHRAVPVVRRKQGLRAVSKGNPIAPESVQRYLEAKFGEAFTAARQAMAILARSMPPDELANTAYAYYERFRPEIPAGKIGWGAARVLDIDRIRSMAR